MPRAVKYTKDEVIAVLIQSEGRVSPVTHQAGHALSMHVNIADHHLTDRLVGMLGQSSTSRPIIVTPSGQVADKATHREIWKELNPGLNSKTANSDFAAMYENYVNSAGAFLDLQQAGLVGKFALNSSEGQARLAELDALGGGVYKRVKIEISMHAYENINAGWKMRYAGIGGVNSDLPHVKDFTKAVMFVDNLDPDGIHIQTFYPVA